MRVVGSHSTQLDNLLTVRNTRIVYTQWLWKTVHKQNLTLNFLNDAFNVDKSVWSLLNWEMLKEMHTGWSMALFAWLVYGSLATNALF